MATIEPLKNLVLSENHPKTLDPKTKERDSKRSTACNFTQPGGTKKGHLGFFTPTRISRSVRYLLVFYDRFFAHRIERSVRTR
jgi:hypothetical protein